MTPEHAHAHPFLDDFRHSHVFLGDSHERNERRTWAVIAMSPRPPEQYSVGFRAFPVCPT